MRDGRVLPPIGVQPPPAHPVAPRREPFDPDLAALVNQNFQPPPRPPVAAARKRKTDGDGARFRLPHPLDAEGEGPPANVEQLRQRIGGPAPRERNLTHFERDLGGRAGEHQQVIDQPLRLSAQPVEAEPLRPDSPSAGLGGAELVACRVAVDPSGSVHQVGRRDWRHPVARQGVACRD